MNVNLLTRGYEVVSLRDIGGVGDNVTDNSTNNAFANALMRLANGGILYIPAGIYRFSQTLVLDQLAFIRIIGAGVCQSGSGALTQLVYTGTGASAISCLSSRGIGFEHIGLRSSNAGFTGYLIDFGPKTLSSSNTANCYLEDCNLWNQAFPSSVPTALIHLGWCYNFTAMHCQFYGGQVNVIGKAAAGEFNNTVNFRNCYLQGAQTAAVKGIDTSWKFDTCTFEPLASGGAGALTYDPAIGAGVSVTFDNCWCGDDSNSVAGSWFTLGDVRAFRMVGGFMGLGALTTGFTLNQNGAQGIRIEDVAIQTANASAAVVNFGATTGHSGFYFTPWYNEVTPAIPVQGTTIPTGLIDYGGGPVLRAQDIQIIGPPRFPNQLSAASADFESGSIGVWNENSNVSALVTSNAAALHGAQCLAVTSANLAQTQMSINSAGIGFAGQIPCSPGQIWLASAVFRCPPGVPPRLLDLDVYASSSSSGANFQAIATSGFHSRDAVAVWVPLSVAVTIPATLPVGGAVPAFLFLIVRWGDNSALPNGETHWMDCVQVRQIRTSTPAAADFLWQDPAQANSTLQLTSALIAQTGTAGKDIVLLPQSTGTLYANVGIGAGTGGLVGARPAFRDGAPTIAAGAGAGAAPTISISGSDSGHVVSLTTDGSPAASSTVFTVTFSNPFPTSPRSVAWSPANGNAASLSGVSAVWEDQASRLAGSYLFKVGSGGLAPTTQYLWNVDVKG